ncbi:mutator type transposase [Tanacetum coccineum]
MVDDGSDRDDGSNSDDDSHRQNSDFLVDPDNMIDDVEVDMVEFRSNIDAKVEWVGGSDSKYEGERKKALKMFHKMNKANASNAESSGTTWKENFYVGLKFSNSKEIKKMATRVAVEHIRELHFKKNHKIKVRCICRGKVPWFSCEDGDDVSSSKGVGSNRSKTKGQSKEKGQVSGSKGKSTNKTKAGGVLKIRENLALGLYNAQNYLMRKHGRSVTETILSRDFKAKGIRSKDGLGKSGRGQLYKEMLWRCATSTTVQRFDKHMEKLKYFNKEAYEWLKKFPSQHWSRSHFSGRAHCDKVISKSDGPLTPNATKVFNRIVKEAGQIKGDQCVVNMRIRECSYRKWELTGIPCKHAVAAIWDIAGNEEKTAEKSIILNTIIPPKTHPQIGRPPKKRKKSVAELAEGMVRGNKLSIASKSISCGKCKGIGHNQRKCPNDASAQTATQTHQSSQAPPATQASQIVHTTPFHPSQLLASPKKMTNATAARRMSYS